MREIKTIMVCGAGYMGSGIAQVCANGGYNVIHWDITQELAQGGYDKIKAGLEKQIAKGKDTPEHVEELLSRLHPTDKIERAAEADLIIEVVLEKLEIKWDLLRKVEQYCDEDAYIATNTAMIPITKLASCLKKPDRFVGMHFFGPVYAMKLLEIIRGEQTSDEAVNMAVEVAPKIGKVPVVVQKDSPGFIVNRLNAAMRVEAFRILHEGVATVEDIDVAMKLGLNHPMGPFELNDLGGLDGTVNSLKVMYDALGEDRWLPTPELMDHVNKGEFGRKTGKGWYDYSKK